MSDLLSVRYGLSFWVCEPESVFPAGHATNPVVSRPGKRGGEEECSGDGRGGGGGGFDGVRTGRYRLNLLNKREVFLFRNAINRNFTDRSAGSGAGG